MRQRILRHIAQDSRQLDEDFNDIGQKRLRREIHKPEDAA
jgi:hypothetical protein